MSARVYGKTAEKRRKWWPYAIPSVGLFLLFILFHLLELAVPGCWSIAWFFYLCFTCQITSIRIKTREIYSIVGNASADRLNEPLDSHPIIASISRSPSLLPGQRSGKSSSINASGKQRSNSVADQIMEGHPTRDMSRAVTTDIQR